MGDEPDGLLLGERRQRFERLDDQHPRIDYFRDDPQPASVQPAYIEEVTYQRIHLLRGLAYERDALGVRFGVPIIRFQNSAAEHPHRRDRIAQIVGYDANHLVPRAQAASDLVVET